MQDDFVANVIEEMRRLGINRAQLAERMRVSKSYVTQVLNKQMTPSLTVVEKFAAALNRPPYELLKPPKKIAASA